MFNAVGFDLTYRLKAFTTTVEPDGMRPAPLESLLMRAARSVQFDSAGRWIIISKDEYLHDDAEAVIELIVFIPVGDNQYDQYLAAVKQFEAHIAAYPLVQPVDITYRTLEDRGPKCEICGKKSEWARHTQFSGIHHFCGIHAEAEEDFGESSSPNFFWRRQEPITT